MPALSELQAGYDNLLESQIDHLQTVFDLPLGRESMRKELSERAARVMDIAADVKLKGFLMRAASDALDEPEWLTSIATLLGGKPPESWRDSDRAVAEMTASRLRQQFATLEAMSVASQQHDDPEVSLVRLSITESGGGEAERVIPLRTKRSQAAALGIAFSGVWVLSLLHT